MNIIEKMLRENTGSHFLDSGSAYGRNHERNQSRKFKSEPAATADFKYGVEVTVNLYHWLADRVTFAPNLDKRFQRFCAKEENKNESYFALVQSWLASLDDVTGIYGEGSPVTVNTYNGEDLLSQTIQFTYFTLDHTSYVLLQIHGGCDVRGGYTTPRVFEASESMFDNARASIYCTNNGKVAGLFGQMEACGAYWDTDDANHWYREGSCGLGAGTQLEAYDRTEQDKGEEWEVGKLHVLSDRSALCPCCGSPLKPAMFPGG